MRRLVAATAAVALVLGMVPGRVAADGNHPPVAVDDPANSPGCGPVDRWGGAFPIPEDFLPDLSAQGWFLFFGACLPTANDSDPDGDPLTLEIVDQPAHGAAIWLPGDPAFFGYRADPDWSTPPGDQPGGTWFSDVVTYRLFDGQAYSNTASYRFWLAPINDPPTFTPGAPLIMAEAYGDPVAVPWATGISPGPANEAGQTVSFDVQASSPGAPGMFAVPPAIDSDGVLTFTPGTEPGLATVTVSAHDDGGMGDYGLGKGTMVPPDDTADPVTFEIAVEPPAPTPPTAVDDRMTVVEDVPTLLGVLANDTDRNGDPLLITGFTDPARGSVDFGSLAGTIFYTPDPDATGTDTFDYTITDGVSGSSTATVTVTIEPQNDAPVAVDDASGVDEGAGPTVIDVLGNDTDVDGDALAVTGVGAAGHGVVSLQAGVVRYQPAAAWSGTDGFDYTIGDGHGGTATAHVTLTVAPDAGPPVIGPLARSLATGVLGAQAVWVRLDWSAQDDGSGVARYELQRRRNDGAWSAVPLPTRTSRAIRLALVAGDRYTFRVRASDLHGTTSAWSSWAPFAPRLHEEAAPAVTWAGTWWTAWRRDLSGGRDRWTAAADRRAVFAFSGRAVGWVGRRSTGGGTAEVRIDSRLVGTVSSRGTATASRVVLFTAALAAGGPHRVEIRPLGDGRVDVDAFVVLP